MEEDLFEEEEGSDVAAEQRRNKGWDNLKPWMFKPGQSGNPSGRPKGTVSLKEFAKKYLREMSDDEKIEFMKGLNKDIVWKMAEGQWQMDVTSGGERIIPVPIIPLDPNAIPVHNSNQENNKPQETN